MGENAIIACLHTAVYLSLTEGANPQGKRTLADIESLVVVYCSCPNEKTALALADRLVEIQAAACVNVINGVQSVYRWQGEINRDHEVLLMIKSTMQSLTHIKKLIVENHPYELPEIIAVPIIGGSDDYLSWIRQNSATK